MPGGNQRTRKTSSNGSRQFSAWGDKNVNVVLGCPSGCPGRRSPWSSRIVRTGFPAQTLRTDAVCVFVAGLAPVPVA